MTKRFVSFFAFILLLFILAISELEAASPKLCENPSITYSGTCNDESCDKKCISWEGAVHGACHEREDKSGCFCYYTSYKDKKPPKGKSPPKKSKSPHPPKAGSPSPSPSSPPSPSPSSTPSPPPTDSATPPSDAGSPPPPADAGSPPPPSDAGSPPPPGYGSPPPA